MSEITLEAVLRDIFFQMSRAEGKRVADIANCFIAEYLNEPCFKLPISRLNELAKADSNGEGIKTCENCVNRFLCPNNYRACDGYMMKNCFGD